MIIQSQKSRKHKPEMRVYDAQPTDAPHRCPRTFCRGCGTMLFAEPSSIGVLVVNCGLFQNHKYHPAMKPSLEIFTTRRSSWLTRREDALQADAMPVFPSAEDDTETEAATSRRSSRATEGQWDGGEGDDADVDEDEDDGDYENYHSDGEDRLGLGHLAKSEPEKRSGGSTPRGERRRLSPTIPVKEEEPETEPDSAVEEPCAFVAQEHGGHAEARSLGLESRSSSGSRGRRRRYQKLEPKRDLSGSTAVPTISSSVR